MIFRVALQQGITVPALIVFLITAGCGLVPEVTDREGSAADSLAVNTRQPQVVVEVALATIADLEAQLSFDGTLEGRAEVDVVPGIAGRLEAVRVQLGDQVKRGQVIAKVRDDDLATQVRQADHAYEVARATFRQREVDLTLAETTFNRSQELFDEQLLARETLDDAKARVQTAAAQVDLARAQFLQNEARVDELRIKLGKATVRSPVNGFVGKRYMDTGAFASTNTPIVSVVDIAQVKLVANISEREFNRLDAGAPARITVDAYPGEIFTGKLARLAPVLDPRTRMTEVEVEVANENFRLRPGMYARVEITAERRKDSVVLPREALVGVGETAGIFVIQRDPSGDVARFVSAKTGLQDGDHIEILEGISEGQYAVTTGASGLTDGDVVTVLGSFEPLTLADQDESYGRSETTSDTLSTELLKEPDGAVATNSSQLETVNPSMARTSLPSQRALEGSLYTVQTGAIRERAEAKEVADQLSVKGYAAYVTTFTEGADRLYRVRVGTFEDQYEAEEIVAGLMQEEQFGEFGIRTFGGTTAVNTESNLDASNALTPTLLQGSEMQVATGSLLASQPSEAVNIELDTPMAVEANTYTVQVGAIRERAEAQQMVDQLFAKGYAAYVMTVTEGTERLYRIRVGAFMERSEAEAMAVRLQEDEQFKTWITK